jgi:futalosine hydrolase
MPFKILYISATNSEVEALTKMPGIVSFPGGYRFEKCMISVLITGVGSISTAWAMKQWLSSNTKPDLAINAGIAGSYIEGLKIGNVVTPVTDCFADVGIETGNNFLTLAEAGLSDPDKFPFKGGYIVADNRYAKNVAKQLPPVRAITVNTATGSAATIERLTNKYNPEIETMEGATFFYICAMERLPFLAIRAISNRVEPRDRIKWDISLALNNLSLKLKNIILTLE